MKRTSMIFILITVCLFFFSSCNLPSQQENNQDASGKQDNFFSLELNFPDIPDRTTVQASAEKQEEEEKQEKQEGIFSFDLNISDSLDFGNEEAPVFKYEDYNLGDMLYFGHYEQDNNTQNGEEKLEWIVLEKQYGRLLLISKYILDFVPYDTAHSVYDSRWGISTLRQWLNDDFYNSAFSKSEKEMICNSLIINEYPTTEADASVTYDNIYVLNQKEFDTLFYDIPDGKTSPVTPYAMMKSGLDPDDGYTETEWWARGYLENYTDLLVDRPASALRLADDANSPEDSSIGVRPVLWVQAELPDGVFDAKEEHTGWTNVFRTRIYLGQYEQDGNTQNGPEPLEWFVLDEYDNGDLLVVSKFFVEAMPFWAALTDTDSDWDTINWETSDVREWLNSEFLNSAFSSKELSLIKTTELSSLHEFNNPREDQFGTYYINTQDKVFVLNTSEFPEEKGTTYVTKGSICEKLLISKEVQDVLGLVERTTEKRTLPGWTRDVKRGFHPFVYLTNVEMELEPSYVLGVRPAMVISQP